MEKLNRGNVIADKADRDLQSYLHFVTKKADLVDQVLTPGYKGQAVMLVASGAWSGGNLASEIHTGSTIIGNLGTSLKGLVEAI